MMLMAFCCLSLVSCDKDDEPAGSDNSTTESGYGEIKPTGLKMANLYLSASDGPDQLKIPGFPPLYMVHDHYNGLCLESTEGGLLNCWIKSDSMESFQWTETTYGFGSRVSLSTDYNSYIYRIKISKVDEYPERFAYARIRFIDYLYSNNGSKIGCVLEYDSPYTPLK